MIFDLAILGGGPAGYVAAEKAGNAGLSVVLFEKQELGGVCLNEGCIPTKALLNCAKTYEHALHGKPFGVSAEGVQADFGAMMERKKRVVRRLVGGVKSRMKGAGVTVVKAEATITGKAAGSFGLNAAGEDYSAAHLLICTGSSAVVPPIPGLRESEAVLTSREILSLTQRPESLTVIGGGVIGMEFASFFNSLGTKVSVIEMMPKILGPMDAEVSAALQGIYAKKGVDFHLGCQVTAVNGNTVVFEVPEGTADGASDGALCHQRAVRKGQCSLVAEGTANGTAECKITSEVILCCVGRKANLTGYGLETLGLNCGRGIEVDSHMRTSVPGVYAAGDVTGFSMLAHTASREAEVAVNDILGVSDEMRYDAIPGVVYTTPEVAGVGVTEEQAPEGSTIRKLPMAYSGRYVAENEDITGLCKIIGGPDGRIIGLHMLGTPCSEIIQSGCIAIEAGLTAGQLEKVVFPHPTVSEIIKETL